MGIGGLIGAIGGAVGGTIGRKIKENINKNKRKGGGGGGGNDPYARDKAQMEANSNAWHTADAEEKKRLERENKRLGERMDSVYNPASGSWTHNNNYNGPSADSLGTPGSDFNQYQDYLNQARAEDEKAQRAQIDKGVNQLAAQIPSLNRSYDDMAKQAYINHRLGERDISQNLAAAGLSGTGTAESTLADKTANYENLLNKGEMQRLGAVEKINQDIANLRASGDIGIAQNAAGYNRQLLDYYNQLLADQRADDKFYEQLDYAKQQDAYNRDFQREQWDYNRDFGREQWDYGKQQDDKDRQHKYYTMLMQLGIVTPEMAKFYEVSMDELKARVRALTNFSMMAGGGGRRGGGGSKSGGSRGGGSSGGTQQNAPIADEPTVEPTHLYRGKESDAYYDVSRNVRNRVEKGNIQGAVDALNGALDRGLITYTELVDIGEHYGIIED